MITLGCDTHKRTHTISAIDELGKVLNSITIENSNSGYGLLWLWIEKHNFKIAYWGIENSQSYGKNLAQFLLKNNEKNVFEITPKLTSMLRKRSLKNDKSDYRDSVAIAMAVLQEKQNLKPVLNENAESNLLKELTRFRKHLVQGKTKYINQLHKALFKLDPEYKKVVGDLRTEISKNKIKEFYLKPKKTEFSSIQNIYRLEIKAILNQLKPLLEEIKKIEKEINTLMNKINSPITSLNGVADILGASILGEIGDIRNYKNSAQLAAKAGISPLENSSSKNCYRKVNPGGNRYLNSTVHRLALFQMAKDELGHKYYLKKKSEGKTSKDALRCLKRRLIDIIFAILKKNTPYKKPDNLMKIQANNIQLKDLSVA